MMMIIQPVNYFKKQVKTVQFSQTLKQFEFFADVKNSFIGGKKRLYSIENGALFQPKVIG
jgi:hypothetical protein